MDFIKLPGFGLPVDYMPGDNRHFPLLLGTGSDFEANTLTNLELCMLRFIEEITNKSDWWIKVHDPTIASQWKTEALEYDWGQYLRYGDFTTAMADACIEEMKLKASLYQQANLLPVYDYTAAIVKPDHLIPDDLWQTLKHGVKVLEDVPAAVKEWHPGSDRKVLNLVHPSMYPLRFLNKTDQSDSEYETEEYDSSKDRDMPDSESEDEDDNEQERDPNHVSEKEVKCRDLRWFYKTHPVVAPEPSPESKLKFCAEDIKLMGFFHNILPETGPQRLQVIVKIANIHLTPEDPNYPGGSWHTEGQINEHICSTALFYYDNENITDSYIDSEPCTIQSVGSVLTREKRALFFPNVFQHHVNSFKLADPTKPRHRKILALFLMDPAIPVISTANVPPQRQDWWPEELGPIGDLPFDERIAKEFRRDLMEERSANEWQAYDKIKRAEWNFCEH
ncbi:duf1665 domain-containing protein [Fusarium phyllophilum]|uniref:Duf1665 domain-containing protein n=1 Tax=Fusarium phyllophilum TaxID=47803 RepID=A0A8H5IME9_9HYPO|nr:duf1665 domain-containing protein [Fusarium phyllophilum]